MKIEICNRCDGTGQVRGEDDGRGNWEYEICPKCDATGRIYTREYKLEYSYGKDVSNLYKVDSAILDLIRKL